MYLKKWITVFKYNNWQNWFIDSQELLKHQLRLVRVLSVGLGVKPSWAKTLDLAKRGVLSQITEIQNQ